MPTEIPDPPAVAHQATADEVHDILADSISTAPFNKGVPVVMSTRKIAETILGFDPTRSRDYRSEKSADTYFNKYISMGKLRKLLDRMVEVGEAVKVSKVHYASNLAERALMRSVDFPYDTRTGYVLTALMDDSTAADAAKQRDRQRGKLRLAAELAIAARHKAEVDALYADECAKEGLDPARETVPEPAPEDPGRRVKSWSDPVVDALDRT